MDASFYSFDEYQYIPYCICCGEELVFEEDYLCDDCYWEEIEEFYEKDEDEELTRAATEDIIRQISED